jgi:hypothetical protein
MSDLTTTTAAADLHADTTTRRALLHELRFAAFATLFGLFALSLPVARMAEETPQHAALVVALYLVVCIGLGVGLVLDGLRRALHTQAADCALTTARLRDREAALRDAEARLRVVCAQHDDEVRARAAFRSLLDAACEERDSARRRGDLATTERDEARNLAEYQTRQIAAMRADLDAALAAAEAARDDARKTDAALAQVQHDAERAEARAEQAEAALDHARLVATRALADAQRVQTEAEAWAEQTANLRAALSERDRAEEAQS